MEHVHVSASFALLEALESTPRVADHGGRGSISFRRLFDAADFTTPIDFVDVSVIYPGSTIGRHSHVGNDEIYFVIEGRPTVNVCGDERRMAPGDVAVVRSGQWHELANDSECDVVIGVVQVREAASS